ncbi:hypothetical protein BWZ43_11520 [Heyndrickxia oleronia]|uniref:Uncharacterized protein n=1 Tax=Heyndrickxia oleronia TaxID=38875 RepID=A0A8E2I8G0_9BACI|nr:hypothetical protein [Heyndrickxia oleronia]OOP68232.1 hypothetical protein BWZ43_11520 [Heyndrickxia oleronia]
MLSFNDVYHLSTHTRGIQQPDMKFDTVSIFSDELQAKGLFIPIHDKNLDKAIENGAIAAVWLNNESLPNYTPNHFPVIFVDDLVSAFHQLCEEYTRKVKQEEYETMTKFIFYSPELLNAQAFTYDIAVEEETDEFASLLENYIESKRRG